MTVTELKPTGLGRPGPAEDGRKAILDAAAQVFATRGYLATSIDAIADALGATKGRVYHYYRGKAEVFLDVVVTGMHELLGGVEPLARAEGATPTERIRRMVRFHASLMMVHNYKQRVTVQAVQNRNVPEIALHREVLEEIFHLRRRYERCFIDVVEEGIAAGDFIPQDSSLAVKSVLGSLNWIPIWYVPERGTSEEMERVATFFADYIVRALKGS